jgi:hypothetical protein
MLTVLIHQFQISKSLPAVGRQMSNEFYMTNTSPLPTVGRHER